MSGPQAESLHVRIDGRATPLARSLARIDPSAHRLHVQIGRASDDWLRPLAQDGGAALMAGLRREALANTGPADPLTVGAIMMWRYAEVNCAAAIVYAQDQRVPHLDPVTLAFRPRSASAPTRVVLGSSHFWCMSTDPDAGHRDARPLPTRDALRARLALEIERYTDVVIELMRAETRIGVKGLWGIASSAALPPIAEHFAAAGDAQRGIEEVEALLCHAPQLRRSPPTFDRVEHAGGQLLAVGFGACCRAYRWEGYDGQKCDSCILHSRPDRLALAIAAAEGGGSCCS